MARRLLRRGAEALRIDAAGTALHPVSLASHLPLIVWTTVTAVSALPVILAYALPGDTLLRLGQFLSVPHRHCILCGMTRAFLLLAHNHPAQAFHMNPLSPFLFYAAGPNALANILFWLGRAMRRIPRQATPHTKERLLCRS